MKIKFLALTLFFLSLTFSLSAQLVNPVKWTFSVKAVSETEAKLVAKATLDKTWHVYGQFSEPAGGIPAKFSFEPNAKAYKTVGKVTEYPKPHKEYDDIMGANVQYFEKEVFFTHKINVLSETDFTINGTFEGQACTEEGMCIPLNADMEFKVKGLANLKAEFSVTDLKDTTDIAVIDSLTKVSSDSNSVVAPVDTTKAEKKSNGGEINSATKKESLWGLFIAAFVAGLAALLTPCVFPMIPMTVSFFMHDTKSKAKSRAEALFFSFSIVAIYTIIGTIVAVAFGPAFANWLSTHWIPNVLFFIIFMIFAASFFGAFEIVLPNWMVQKSEAQVDKGGKLAPFFMALSLVVISFSCTGPLVGTVLVESAGGGFLKPIIGMMGFGLAFAIPFGIFAFFPHLLQKMPESGGWLNSVKVVLGFIEVALGLKFLSIADLTYHWGLLDRHVYLALWIVIFSLMGLYLLGKLKFSHDSDLPFLKVPRLFFAIFTFAFVVYMIPGMFGAPLKLLSGYLPPMSTHEFDVAKVVRENSGNSKVEGCEESKYSDKHEMPHGLSGYFDFDQALACAKATNKPILVDFTGYACVNCRKMEDNVWGESQVLPHLKDDYIIVSLYVDDRTELPESEWVTSTYDGKIKKTLGAKYADYQISRFGMNAQPAYIVLDANNNVLMKDPYFYNPDPAAFADYLKKGVEIFKSSSKK